MTLAAAEQAVWWKNSPIFSHYRHRGALTRKCLTSSGSAIRLQCLRTLEVDPGFSVRRSSKLYHLPIFLKKLLHKGCVIGVPLKHFKLGFGKVKTFHLQNPKSSLVLNIFNLLCFDDKNCLVGTPVGGPGPCSTFYFYVHSSFSIIRHFLPNPASIDREEQNKKLPLVGIEPTTSWSSL